MSLPDFLIIGAMKAGTTSLYQDLKQNPTIYMPSDKEPNNLCHDEVLTEKGRRDYAKLFVKAKPGQICGEASTAYSKLPEFPGVPQRAKQLLGENLKVIYLVRDPIARIISHHHHEISSGVITCNIDEAVERYPRFLNFSRYAMQIQPWIDALSRDNVLIIHFETYINNRMETVESTSRFLDLAPCTLAIDQEEVFNKTQGKPVVKGLVAKIRLSSLYRRFLRPLISFSARDRIRKTLLPQAQARPTAPASATSQYIMDQIHSDLKELAGLMQSDKPLWESTDKT